MNGFFQYYFWMWVVAGLGAFRQLLVLWTAEQGRKHDLVKKLYKNHQEFHLSILIPFLDSNDHPALLTLLQAIHEQEYPAAKVAVHIVTTEEGKRDLVPQSLRSNVKVWAYPTPTCRYEHALTWLIERCLAAGGNGLFIFLKPTDIIKPDFFQNVVARGIDSFAIQGYVALKNPPATLLAKVVALSGRLFNRIGNAGRYHMGLSCRLLDSGWAIKQEVLEMIPFHRGMDMDNLEYTIRLNLENFRVNWAPNVVVYSDSEVSFVEYLTLCTGAFFNRMSLLLRYGPRLLARMLLRMDFNFLEQLLSIVKPPYMLMAIVFGLLAVLDAKSNVPIPGEPVFWAVTAVVSLVLSVIGLWVSRCKTADYVTMLFYAPLTYLAGLLASPMALFNYLSNAMSKRAVKGSTYRKTQMTRFNEELDAPPNLFDEAHGQNVIRNILKKNAPKSEREVQELIARVEAKQKQRKRVPDEAFAGETALPVENTNASAIAASAKLPRETVRSVPLSNGKKQVSCTLKTLTTFDENEDAFYKLTLEYKSMSFSTESYRILDQAFYELHAKLTSRGLALVTCGSCGYFYNPTADVPGALRNAGVCLYGKTGREVNLNTDAVTVMSQACPQHCSLNQREGIVRQWKESLALSRVR